MALTPGTRLGVFTLNELIGRGGMGEVYRARDTKLGRDVAIKVLPEAFAHDADRLARFQREAKTLASLNHPNIAAIYGIEESEGITALAMELVEGPTLADIIAGSGLWALGSRPASDLQAHSPKPTAESRRGIPLDEALPIAKQIADALEAAHEQHIRSRACRA